MKKLAFIIVDRMVHRKLLWALTIVAITLYCTYSLSAIAKDSCANQSLNSRQSNSQKPASPEEQSPATEEQDEAPPPPPPPEQAEVV